MGVVPMVLSLPKAMPLLDQIAFGACTLWHLAEPQQIKVRQPLTKNHPGRLARSVQAVQAWLCPHALWPGTSDGTCSEWLCHIALVKNSEAAVHEPGQ